MKKLFSIFLLFILFFGLSFTNKFSVLISFSLFLILFVAYMFITSKKSKFDIVTLSYVGFSIAFAIYAQTAILMIHKMSFSIITIIFLFIITPSFFLLGYKTALSFHCLINSIFPSKNEIHDKCTDIGCSIVIATRNEPFDVCKMTFDSAYTLDYPANLKEIIIVDNSDLTNKDFLAWQEYVSKKNGKDGIKCKFIHRDGTQGFKPRNLDIATENICFDYILFLDADSTLPSNALKVGLNEFKKNNKLGFVSFLIESTNYEVNLVTKVASIFQNTIRYLNEFTGKYGYCNYQGHNGIWSKKAIKAISKWEEYHKSQVMITEDVAASFRCYKAGFISKSIFLKTGEWVPTSLQEFEKMWLRWSFGGMQVMGEYMSKIVHSKKLSFRIKLDMLYLIFKVVASGFPFFALIVVIFPNKNPAFILTTNVTLAPLIILSIWYYFYGYVKGNFFSKLLQIYIAMFMLSSFVFWCGIKSEINYYLNKSQGWKPTNKSFEDSQSWVKIILNNIGKLSFSIIGLTVACFSAFRLYGDNEYYMYLLCMVPSILLFLNTILCVIVLGKSSTTYHQS